MTTKQTIKPDYGWVVVCPKGVKDLLTFMRIKSDSIKIFCDFQDEFPEGWRGFHKKGFRCVKVKIEVVK